MVREDLIHININDLFHFKGNISGILQDQYVDLRVDIADDCAFHACANKQLKCVLPCAVIVFPRCG